MFFLSHFMNLWMCKIGCVDYARFPKSGLIYTYAGASQNYRYYQYYCQIYVFKLKNWNNSVYSKM